MVNRWIGQIVTLFNENRELLLHLLAGRLVGCPGSNLCCASQILEAAPVNAHLKNVDVLNG
jgi:hypothetical protein